MMNGGMWGLAWMGDDGGIWVPIFLVLMTIAFVAWIIKQKAK